MLLQRLPATEWTVVCDQERRHGVDHVIVGPAGVFALASRLPEGVGAARVKDGMLWLRRGPDPREDRAGAAINRHALESARILRQEIAARVGGASGRLEVWPVVVLWCEFPQAVAEGSRVAFVRGLDLVDWIASRPRRLDCEDRARLADVVSLLPREASSGLQPMQSGRVEGGVEPASRRRRTLWPRIGSRRAA